ncbi:MAG: energy transducer TonB [Crocinitomicaceae bacterium]|nr:energy transducer TonB [Crocinitomicaceae bacterium]
MEFKKNPEVDNENLRTPLVFLGFFIVGSIILLSFSFKSAIYGDSIDRDNRDAGDIPEEQMVIDQPEEPPVVQDIPPPDITPPPSEDIVEEESRDEDEPIIVETPPIELDLEPEPEPEAPIVDYPDQEATFPGGAAAMKQFLADKIKYPEIAMELGDQGKVFIEFVVEKDGSITQIKILRGVSKEIDREAKRVVSSMPKWAPAEAKGEAVRARCRIPISFILQ